MKGAGKEAAPSRPCSTFLLTMEIRALTQFGRERLCARPFVITRHGFVSAVPGRRFSSDVRPKIDSSSSRAFHKARLFAREVAVRLTA